MTARYAYTLDEVAEMTGLSWDSLDKGCRRREIAFTWWRRQRVMTPAQIERFLVSNEVVPGDAGGVHADGSGSELEQRRAQIRDRLAKRQKRAA